ncbi:hypothetical protein SK128_014266 [Halocaridina rubra]|uniref:Uncharacterized protein n=1 Tax=Halocaridina rubra TaxID=373956 RepID=A0AAN8WRB1_HALRR
MEMTEGNGIRPYKTNGETGLVTVILIATVCHGYQIHIFPDKNDDVLPRKLRRARSPREKLNMGEDASMESLSIEEYVTTLPVPMTEEKRPLISREIKNKRDTNGSLHPVNNTTDAESRQDTMTSSTTFPDEVPEDPDRIGFLFSLLPVLEYPFRPIWLPLSFGKSPYNVRGNNRPPPYKPPPPPLHHPPPPPPPPPPPHPPLPPFPIGHKPSPHPIDFIPKPLPPFHSDGPHFTDHHPPSFSEHHSNDADHDFEALHKPHDDDIIHDDSFFDDMGDDDFHDSESFDFEPPDFFENSGFPHSSGEVHFDEKPIHDHHEDMMSHPPHHPSGDFRPHHPPEDFLPHRPPPDDFKPHFFAGPPKPPKVFSIPPKPGPPRPPPKLPVPPGINAVVNENIYRDDIPVVEIHNEKDKIHEGLVHGGIKGLNQGDIDFITVHTKPYVESHNEFDAQL